MAKQTKDPQVNYDLNRAGGDSYLPDAARIFAELVGPVKVGNVYQDIHLGADLIADCDITLGVRIRDEKYDRRYGNEFTVRSWHPKSKRCELHKLMEGKPKLLLYGFASKTRGLYKYAIIQTQCIADAVKEGLYEKQTNKDGIEFYAFNIDDVLERFPYAIICSQGY